MTKMNSVATFIVMEKHLPTCYAMIYSTLGTHNQILSKMLLPQQYQRESQCKTSKTDQLKFYVISSFHVKNSMFFHMDVGNNEIV